MSDRRAMQKLAAGLVATVSTGGALLGLAGTASASPVPGTPLTPEKNCVENGGQVSENVPGVKRCFGGGDTGDFIISEEQGEAYRQTVPKPLVGLPSLPSFP